MFVTNGQLGGISPFNSFPYHVRARDMPRGIHFQSKTEQEYSRETFELSRSIFHALYCMNREMINSFHNCLLFS